MLAATEHLEKWRNRNYTQGAVLKHELEGQFICDEPTTLRVAHWSYEHGFSTSSQVWVSTGNVSPLTDDYRRILQSPAALVSLSDPNTAAVTSLLG
jgi:hypothetical protein